MYKNAYQRGTFKILATLAPQHHRLADSRDVGGQNASVGTDKGEQTDEGNESLTSENESESGSDETDSSSSNDSNGDSHVTTPEPLSLQDPVEWAKEQDNEAKIKINLKPLIKQLRGYWVDDGTMLLVFKKLDLLYAYQPQHRQLVGNILAEECTADILQCISNLMCYDSANSEKNSLVKMVLGIVWTYTESSEELAKEIAEHDGVAMMTEMQRQSFLKDQASQEMKNYIPRASLSILHNLAKDPSLKRKFEKAKTAEAVLPWLEGDDKFNCMVAALILAHIGNSDTKKKTKEAEREQGDHVGGQASNKQTQEEPDPVISTVIENCVAWLTIGLEMENRRFWGFSVRELTLGLAKLAASDANKSKIIAEGALPAFLQVLKHTDHKEQLAALECLGTLSFDDSARKSIEQFPDLVSAVEKLKESSSTEVKKNALGVLWQINEGNAKTSDLDTNKPQEFEYDVFISYSHKQKELVHKIYAELTAEKLKVWLDIHNMKGSIFDSMAQAVETSAVVLLCMSADYQNSANCKREAEMTAKSGRPFMPLMVQPNYKPRAWLDVVIGTELWIDFAGQQPFKSSMKQLLRDLNEKISSSKENSHVGRRSAVSHTAPDNSQPLPTKASTMTPPETLKFLKSKGLTNIPQELAILDGKVLGKLKELMKIDVKYFHKTLKEDYGMSLVDILKLSVALDDM